MALVLQKNCTPSRQIHKTLSKHILVVKITNLDKEENEWPEEYRVCYVHLLAATVAGPLTIKRNQCEHVETNSTDTAIIVNTNNKFKDGVQDKKVELNRRARTSEHEQTRE